MSEELILTQSGASDIAPTELHMRRLLAGDAESVRARLIPALEALRYIVISEDPLQAHRAASRAARSYASNDILQYNIKLTIALKQTGATTTRATFSYAVTHPMLTKGDHQTIAREADAAVALAVVRGTLATCAACGTDADGDSRFCRHCGAPLAGGVPAELEVMRLTAGARSAHHTIVTGIITFLCALPFLLISAFGTKANAFVAGIIMFACVALPAIITLLFGVRRLHRTLNPGAATTPALLSAASAATLAPDAHARAALRATESPSYLAAPSARTAEAGAHNLFSVTEGTTELLHLERGATTDRDLRDRRSDPAA